MIVLQFRPAIRNQQLEEHSVKRLGLRPI